MKNSNGGSAKTSKNSGNALAAVAPETTPVTAGNAVVISKVLISDEPGAKGRPSDPTSARQLRLAAQKAKQEAGETLHRGRPSDPTSARAIRMAEMEAKKAQGIELKRGRPTDPTSDRQIKLAENAGKTKRIALKKGELITVNHPDLENMKQLKVVKVTKDTVIIQNGNDKFGYTVPKELIVKLAAEPGNTVAVAV